MGQYEVRSGSVPLPVPTSLAVRSRGLGPNVVLEYIHPGHDERDKGSPNENVGHLVGW